MKPTLILALTALLAGVASAGKGDRVTRTIVHEGTQRLFEVHFESPLPRTLEKAVDSPGSWVVVRRPRKGNVEGIQISSKPLGELDDAEATIIGVTIQIREADFDMRDGYELITTVDEISTKPITLWTGEEPPAQAGEPAREGYVRLIDSHAFRLDVKNGTSKDGGLAVAVDYYLSLSKNLAESSGLLSGSDFEVEFTSKGFLTFPQDGNDEDKDEGGSDSIVNKLALKLSQFRFPHSRTGEGARAGEPGIIPSTELPSFLAGNYAPGSYDALAFDLGLHVKYETTQDLDDYDATVGLGVAATIPFPRLSHGAIPIPLLPLAPLLLTDRTHLAAVQQPLFGIDVDWVFKSDSAPRMAMTPDDEYARVLFEVGWTSEVVRANTWLYATYGIAVELDAPSAIRMADQDVNSFFEVGLKIPLRATKDEGRWFIIKYTTGALPPNYGEASQVSAGFSFDF